MSSYSFKIQKADHVGDLHVHVYYNEGKNRKPLGKYSMIKLKPLPGSKYQLSNKEKEILRSWLSNPQQKKKLQDCLESTVFNMHEIISELMKQGQITNQRGRTFITINIPIGERL